jgi:hypothetical protein
MYKYETQAYIFSCSSYGVFPVPFNECIYQLLNEYWPTGI